MENMPEVTTTPMKYTAQSGHLNSPTSVADPMNTSDIPRCFVCFGDEEDGTELLRDVCSCRGTSKENCCFPCAVNCAKSKTMDVIESERFNYPAVRKAWSTCTNCKQEWTQEMYLKMAAELSEFARNEFPYHDGLRIEALRLRLVGSFYKGLKVRKLAADVLLSAIIQSEESESDQDYVSGCLADNMLYAHRELGDIALDNAEPTVAVEHYEKAKEILERGNRDKWLVLRTDVWIADAKAKMPNVDTVECMKKNLGLFTEYFELSKEKFGGCSNIALYAGFRLSNALIDSDQFVRCERQRLENYKISKQIHGEDHHRTKLCKDVLEAIQKRRCILSNGDGIFYQVLEYDKAEDEYLLKDLDDEGGEDETFTCPADQVICRRGTPVICHGLTGVQEQLNGKLAEVAGWDVGEYEVRLEGETRLHHIKPSNVRVAIDLPPRD